MWPLIILGALTKLMAGQNSSNRQEYLRRSMEAYQRSKVAETDAATRELMAKQTPQAREAELSQLTTDREKSMRDSVGAAQAFDMGPTAGKISSDYQGAQQATAARVAERTRRAIEQLASIGAPGEQKQAFGMRFGRAAGTVDAANRGSENVGRAYVGAIQNTHPSPFLMMAGDAMMAGGAAGAGGSGGSQPNLTSPRNVEWGSMDNGPGAYTVTPTWKDRLSNGFSIWGRGS